MRIGITGVPGSGKTTLSKLICEKYNFKYVSVNDLVNEKELWTTIDARDDAKVVNMIALKKELLNLPDNCVIEGHLLCEFPVQLDMLIILRVPIKLLEKRLTEVFFFSRGIDWKFDSFGIEKTGSRGTDVLGYYIFRAVEIEKLQKLFIEEFKDYENAIKITCSVSKYEKVEESFFELEI